MTQVRKSRDVSGTYLSIPWACKSVVVITAANVSEQAGAKQVLFKLDQVRNKPSAWLRLPHG
nr:hypothetical protein [Hassalia byssoidea]